MIKIMRPDENGKQGLIDICNHIQKEIKIEKMCEIGSYTGQSTLIFYKNLNNIKELISVDPFSLSFNSDNLFDTNNINDIYKIFLNNIKPHQNIKHIKLSSEEASKNFNDEYFDFIYIDGCHKYESIINDINCWKTKIKKGGFIGFHDADSQNVVRAVSSFFDFNSGYITSDNSITFRI